uniref:Saposin B-type domain-containing protein n=1 Tax=Angiostrongylus cantonensis TaxID=6313 RepID=A0A0K0DFN3_ANGCA
MVPVGAVLLLAFASSLLTDAVQVGITCSMCKTELASISEKIHSYPGLMAQMSGTISQSCDQIPDDLQRKACREAVDENSPLFLQNFMKTAEASAENLCKSMGYCQ